MSGTHGTLAQSSSPEHQILTSVPYQCALNLQCLELAAMGVARCRAPAPSGCPIARRALGRAPAALLCGVPGWWRSGLPERCSVEFGVVEFGVARHRPEDTGGCGQAGSRARLHASSRGVTRPSRACLGSRVRRGEVQRFLRSAPLLTRDAAKWFSGVSKNSAAGAAWDERLSGGPRF